MAPGITCVLVDDDPDFRELEKHYLAESCPGIHIVDFAGAAEALAYLKRHDVDLVISDYRMPIMTGLDLTTAIRRFAPHLPILVVSEESDIGPRALVAGATVFMPKGVFRKNHRAILDELALSAAATRRPRRSA